MTVAIQFDAGPLGGLLEAEEKVSVKQK